MRALRTIMITGLFMGLVAGVQAQTNGILRSWAYAQQWTPGMAEEGEEKHERLDHFVYVEVLPGTTIEVKYLWVGAKCHTVKMEKMKTPVVQLNTEDPAAAASVTLVPRTTNKVIQLLEDAEQDDRQLRTGRKLAQRYPFVIAYIYKGKWYYHTGKKLIRLKDRMGI